MYDQICILVYTCILVSVFLCSQIAEVDTLLLILMSFTRSRSTPSHQVTRECTLQTWQFQQESAVVVY